MTWFKHSVFTTGCIAFELSPILQMYSNKYKIGFRASVYVTEYAWLTVYTVLVFVVLVASIRKTNLKGKTAGKNGPCVVL